MLKHIPVAAAAILTVGCTADLAVYHADGTRAKGVPVPITETFAIISENDAHSSGRDCVLVIQTTFETMQSSVAYVDPVTGPLADSEFSLKFNESGMLSEVTLNSESNAADTLKAVGEVAGEIAEILSPGAGIAALQPSGQQPVSCDVSQTAPVVVPLSEYVTDHGAVTALLAQRRNVQ